VDMLDYRAIHQVSEEKIALTPGPSGARIARPASYNT
jgi:hypothetical protein